MKCTKFVVSCLSEALHNIGYYLIPNFTMSSFTHQTIRNFKKPTFIYNKRVYWCQHMLQPSQIVNTNIHKFPYLLLLIQYLYFPGTNTASFIAFRYCTFLFKVLTAFTESPLVFRSLGRKPMLNLGVKCTFVHAFLSFVHHSLHILDFLTVLLSSTRGFLQST